MNLQDLQNLLKTPVVSGNELWRLLLFALWMLLGLLGGRYAQFLLHRGVKSQFANRRRVLSTTLAALAKSVVLFGFALGLQAGSLALRLPQGLRDAVGTVNEILFALAVGHLLYHMVEVILQWLRVAISATGTGMDAMFLPVVRTSLRVVIVLLLVLHLATLLADKPLTSLLAGLGVAGLAVSLAAQDTIRNFFGSLLIFADKPFEIGDRVVVDGFDGPVEEVGFRSTRLRTLEGHQVTIPNGELANRTLQNIGRRPHIRRLFRVGLTYDTPPTGITRALTILRELLRDHEGQHPDFPPRVYFEGFGDFSLNLLVIYWYHPPEYWAYMDHAERLNLQILEQFNEAGLSFAFPTQTLHIEANDRPPHPLPPA